MQPYHLSKQPWKISTSGELGRSQSWIKQPKSSKLDLMNSFIGYPIIIAMIANEETHGKEPLIDYFNSHVVISNRYLVVLK